MPEKFPEPNSLSSMEGVPRQDVPVVFAKEDRVDIPVMQREVPSTALAPKEPEMHTKAEQVEVPEVEKPSGLIRLPPSFYREMMVISSNLGDKETFNKFRKAVTAEEKSVIEKDAFSQSQESFQKLSHAFSSLDFAKEDLKELDEALDGAYEFLSKTEHELSVIGLVTGSSRYEPLVRLFSKVHLLLTDLGLACRKEAHRQESVWVRMFSKDRTNIIALSGILRDFLEGLENLYGALSRGEGLDQALYSRLLVREWSRADFEEGRVFPH